MKCENCISDGSGFVPGIGPTDAELVLVGEAPGMDEHISKIPFTGKTGKELDNYLLTLSHIDRSKCYLTNLLKCRPPGNRDPRPLEIRFCSAILEQEIASINPKYVACLGRFSTRYFLGDDVNLERVHGIPISKDGRIFIPMYHPAAGIHNTSLMIQIASDFEALGRVVRGEMIVGSIIDKYPVGKCKYELARDMNHVSSYMGGDITIAIDTESAKDKSQIPWAGGMVPWCISISTCPGTALVVMVDDKDSMRVVGEKLSDPSTTTIVHNIMYDLPILQQVGILPAKYYCTMVMAYLTQSLPQGLKDLSYRLLGMEMSSYYEVIRHESEKNAVEYLSRVVEIEWRDPEPELVWEKAGPRVKKGWPLQKRANRILSDYGKDYTVDIRDRWENIEHRLRYQAEVKLGIMPVGDLSEVPMEVAVKYSARDADATYRVFPHLLERLSVMNIER